MLNSHVSGSITNFFLSSPNYRIKYDIEMNSTTEEMFSYLITQLEQSPSSEYLKSLSDLLQDSKDLDVNGLRQFMGDLNGFLIDRNTFFSDSSYLDSLAAYDTKVKKDYNTIKGIIVALTLPSSSDVERSYADELMYLDYLRYSTDEPELLHMV